MLINGAEGKYAREAATPTLPLKKIIFTGGGTAGHVTPNLALISHLSKEGWQIHYIGSNQGIEKRLIHEANIPFYAISSGKLRRYFDLKNIKDPFLVLKGIFQAYFLIKRLKPQLVFSKGGFIAVPVVIGSWLNRIPVVIHESDFSPGLANKISKPFATKVCVTFPETLKHFTSGKAVYTGLPIRGEMLNGQAQAGYEFCRFNKAKPVLLIMGGSLGARAINQAVRGQLQALLADYQIVHLCGKGSLDPNLEGMKGYRQFEYLHHELPDIMAMADFVISRAGSTAIYEFLALRKPMLLIPLPLKSSRGDQLLNARSFAERGYSKVLYEEELSPDSLCRAIAELVRENERYRTAMMKSSRFDSIHAVLSIIKAEIQ